MTVTIRGDETQSAALPPEQLLLTALECHRAGRFEQARELYTQVLASEPLHFVCLHHLGLIAHQGGDHATALTLIERAVAIQPDYVEAYSNLAAVRRALGDSAGAREAAEKALFLKPDFAQAYCNKGGALEDLGRLEEALAAYRQAISLNPNFVEACANTANILRKLGGAEEAISVCEEIIAQRPDAPDPYFSLGNILKSLSRTDDAITAYRRALALRPSFAEVYTNLGNVLQTKEAFEEAIEAYRQATALRPELVEAHMGMGAAYENLNRIGEAIACYREALARNPDLYSLRVWLHHKRRFICDWDGIMEEEAELLGLIGTGCALGNPFPFLALEASAADQLQICHDYVKPYEETQKPFAHQRPIAPRQGRKLRIGYLSADFYRHATALLMVELFERHDRAGFEIIGYSHGPDDHSELGMRVKEAFDRFIDVRTLSDAEVAAQIRTDGIDLLIDLKGHTKDGRTGILAHRPAPVQVNYVGFPGTMGANFIDYIIADPFVLPMDQQPFFAEKIVHLPHSYQPNDSHRLIADFPPTRAECGLPEEGLVFCTFNNTYKLTPAFFDIWMRLLRAVPGSVLWILDAQVLVKENLRREAEKRGVDPSRLVFAPRLASPWHLARHRLADLFLDCLPCNAHTTASDALWAGLPVLTCAGETFAGRVAGSLLHAVGLPELVTYSLEDYEALALRLAREPDCLKQLKHKLLGQRLTAPLFDIKRYTQGLEAAYTTMWENWAEGHEPRSFAVAPVVAEGAPPPATRIAFHQCPLCGSGEFQAFLGADCSKHPLFQPSLPASVNWMRCGACSHVFTEGYFDETIAASHFYKKQLGESVGYEMEKLRTGSARIVERVCRHLSHADRHKALGSWLDVSFGNGSLLFTAEEWGFSPVGLDPRPENVRVLAGLGFEAHHGKIEDFDWAERFSVISMANVLERLPYPQEALAAARRMLGRNGVLFLSMPNMGSMVWRFLHANQINPHWGEIRNYHMFSRERLYALLVAQGFRAVEFNIDESSRVGMEVVAVRDDG